MKQLERLSQAIRVWEDRLFLHGMRKRLPGKKQPNEQLDAIAKNYLGLRQALNDSELAEKLQATVTKYVPSDVPNNALDIILCTIPLQVGLWMSESRRGIRLSRDLQALLNATSLRNLTWADIPWLNSAFVVGLEEPLKDSKGRTFDAILVNCANIPNPHTGETESRVFFRLFSKALEQAPMNSVTKTTIEKAATTPVREQTLRSAIDAAEKKTISGSMAVFNLREDILGDTLVTESVNDLLLKQHGRLCNCGGTHPEWDQAVRLVIGLCMYIDSLPDDSELVSPWKPCPNPMLHGAESCIVYTDKPLTTDLRRTFLGLGRIDSGDPRDIPAHFKPGHYRRPPRRRDATGEDTRTKTVHVRPHIVLRSKASLAQRDDLDLKLSDAEKPQDSQ